MTEPEKRPEQTINATDLSVDQLIGQIAAVEPDVRIFVQGVSESQAGFLAGVSAHHELIIQGSVGPMAFMASQNAQFEVFGNAGLCCGHSLQTGSILIRGEAGNFLAAYAAGGYLAVHGRAGDQVAYGLSGADVLVRSRCGNMAAAAMRSGTLVLGNGCGDGLGHGMTGGTIYVRGEVGAVADNLQQGRMKETDTIRLSLMLVRAGIKTTYEKFSVFRVRGDKG